MEKKTKHLGTTFPTGNGLAFFQKLKKISIKSIKERKKLLDLV